MNYQKILSKLIFLSILALFSFNFAFGLEIENPLKYSSFANLFNALVSFLFNLGLVVAPLMIVVAAYFFLFSGGDPKNIETAKKIIIYTFVGLLILFLSKAIVALFKNALGVK